jgi:RecB family endonuclease NucS
MDPDRMSFPIPMRARKGEILKEKELVQTVGHDLQEIEDCLTLFGMFYSPYEVSCFIDAKCVGRMDLVAFDRQGRLVVIECKIGTASHSALGQVMCYMSLLCTQCLSAGMPVRCMIVARRFAPIVVHTARRLKNIPIDLIAYTPGKGYRKVA